MWFPYAAPFYVARIGVAISQPVVDRAKTLRARFHFNTQCAATDHGVEIVTAFDTFARSCAPPIFMAIRLGCVRRLLALVKSYCPIDPTIQRGL